MSDPIFAEARRKFELIPGAGSLQNAISMLRKGGIDQARIRAWAISISEEYGVVFYCRSVIDQIEAA